MRRGGGGKGEKRRGGKGEKRRGGKGEIQGMGERRTMRAQQQGKLPVIMKRIVMKINTL